MKVNQAASNAVDRSESRDVSRAKQATKTADAKETRAAGGGAAADAQASISPKAKEFAKAQAIAQQTPDVRESKIAELKKRIAEGRYNVDPDKVADRLVNEHLSSGIG